MGAAKSKEAPSTPKQAVDLTALHARVDRVHISGLQRTHDDYVQRAVQNLFQATSFQDVLLETSYAKNNLSDLGVFKDIEVTIDVSKGPNASKDGYEITFNGLEKGRITGSVGTEIGQNEGAATAELALPNIAGRGERVALHMSYGNHKTTDVNLRLTKPYNHTVMGAYKPETSISVFKNSAQYPWSKYTTKDMGVLLDCSFLLPLSVHHTFQYEYAMREIETMAKQVPFFVREHCGPRLASVFRHICSYDQRDSTALPTEGIFVKMTNEISGFGGNIAYVKNNTHAEINVPLFAGISAQLCGRVGIIQHDKKSAAVPISSLFILGGPLTIRGFHTGGVGRHIEGAVTGAQTYWAGGLHLWSPLPFNRHFGALANHLRMHAFANVGNVDNFTTNGIRSSIGAGLAFKIGERARIELNYSKPLTRDAGDFVCKEGFQFGIGYEFV